MPLERPKGYDEVTRDETMLSVLRTCVYTLESLVEAVLPRFFLESRPSFASMYGTCHLTPKRTKPQVSSTICGERASLCLFVVRPILWATGARTWLASMFLALRDRACWIHTCSGGGATLEVHFGDSFASSAGRSWKGGFWPTIVGTCFFVRGSVAVRLIPFINDASHHTCCWKRCAGSGCIHSSGRVHGMKWA